MGEVFRARDTRLDREVAIKVLPAELARDEERLARFRREAHLLAALNHPNIAAIHGLDEADGKPFLVLELVPGEDLARGSSAGRSPWTRPCPSRARWPRPSRRPTRRASSTATSSPRTSR
jgi:eukaryotic-like serine/threonine-protein kinase